MSFTYVLLKRLEPAEAIAALDAFVWAQPDSFVGARVIRLRFGVCHHISIYKGDHCRLVSEIAVCGWTSLRDVSLTTWRFVGLL